MSNRKIDYSTLESLKLNFSERAESAVQSFVDYCFIVKRMELKIQLIKSEERNYCDSFTKEENNQVIKRLDSQRTNLHNIAIANVKGLNNLANLLKMDAFMDGSISEGSKDRTEIADSLFVFCEKLHQQEHVKYAELQIPRSLEAAQQSPPTEQQETPVICEPVAKPRQRTNHAARYESDSGVLTYPPENSPTVELTYADLGS
jgi:limonene-1,2-epoxide hydrolase